MFIVEVALFGVVMCSTSCSSPERVAKQDAKECVRALRKNDSEAYIKAKQKCDKHQEDFLEQDVKKMKGEKGLRYYYTLNRYLDMYDAH